MTQQKPDSNKQTPQNSLSDLPYTDLLFIPDTELETELAAALKNNCFELHLQPQVKLNNWSLAGVEALLRWQHPTYGVIPPEHFLPVLEQSGMLDELGHWVLQEACRLNKVWQDGGAAPLRIAINIAASQWRHTKFHDTVMDILTTAGFTPAQLVFEIAEEGLMTESDRQLFERLRHHGIKLALNYTGKGLTSACDISDLPIDIIKIDKSLTQHIVNNRQDRSIMQTLLSFAHENTLEVIAEGVETAQQLLFLNALQCTTAQGFLLSHPLPIENFTALYQHDARFDYLIDKISRQWQNR